MTEDEKKQADEDLTRLTREVIEEQDKKVLKECLHVIDPDTVTYNKKYGRQGVCKLCGEKLVQYRFAKTKHGKARMSKKARRKLMKENRET